MKRRVYVNGVLDIIAHLAVILAVVSAIAIV